MRKLCILFYASFCIWIFPGRSYGEEQPIISKAVAIAIAKKIHAQGQVNDSSQVQADLVKFENDSIKTVGAANLVSTGMKDGDDESFLKWRRSLEGKLIWHIYIRNGYVGRSYYVDVITGADVSFRKDM